METISWVPLESNPDMMNNLIDNLGVSSEWKFVDIYGFEEDLLSFIPQPVLSVILLFPCGEIGSPDSQPECDRKPDESGDSPKEMSATCKDENAIYFMAQTIQNACGTIAIIHSVANVMDSITFTENSSLKKFIEDTKGLTPLAKAEVLMNTAVISDTLHEIAQTGQTEAPDPTANTDCHFVALTHINGHLYELDGRKPGPINHGPSSPATFLKDATRICQAYLDKSPQSFKFSALALCKDV
ncbi:ubiquitin carboxyl-terminal hydrolase isozyme L3-like [Panonychus citri]|uniref:ubiquitin carboxyl-terminal hydrolase isozyme L3-like n=1 Tax=Panonychus citri TaxID=50023 RepID=UPI0023072680|nr:ubiquitin carboxyl-terminal hydrolase isozyme L3-like [Panonychus citri]